MDKNLLAHPKTKQSLERYIKSPSQTLLLKGPSGSGKSGIGRQLIATLLNIPVAEVGLNPGVLIIKRSEESSVISVEQTRQILNFLQLKTLGTAKWRRAVMVEEADAMNSESQNMMLKVLEAVPEDTLFVFTASQPQLLLPTVRSRLQVISVLPLTADMIQARLSGQYPDSEISKAIALSGGLAGLLLALLEDNQDHPLHKTIDEAKRLLAMPKYERLVYQSTIDTSVARLSELLFGLQRVATALYRQRVLSGQTQQARRLLKARRLINDCYDQLSARTNSKLLLTNLLLNL